MEAVQQTSNESIMEAVQQRTDESTLDLLCINTIRTLSLDAVQAQTPLILGC